VHPAGISQAPVLGQLYGGIINRASDLGIVGISEAFSGMRAEPNLAAGHIVRTRESQDQRVKVPVIGQRRGLNLYIRELSPGVYAGLAQFQFPLFLLLSR